MDPVSAVGLASSILTFIEFSWKLVRGTYEVYNSTTGTTAANAHISNVIGDLRELTDALYSDFTGANQHEMELLRLAERCRELSGDLATILEKLKKKGDSKWESLKRAWKSIRKEQEIGSLEKRLESYRSEMLLRINLMICGQHSSIRDHLDQIQQQGQQLSTQTARELQGSRELLRNTLAELRAAIGSAGAPNEVPQHTETIASLSTELLRAIQILESKARALPQENAVLRRLYFSSIHQREDSVDPAARDTFSWMVDSDENEQQSDNDEDEKWSHYDEDEQPEPFLKKYRERQQRRMRREKSKAFMSFLRHDHGVFFISGAPGAGKSTLMKFLASHRRVRNEVELWATPKQLIMLSVFFWSSGDQLQMSLEGFYRALLFNVLQQCPDLISVLFAAESNGGLPEYEDSFRMPQMVAAAQKLAEAGTLSNRRLCLFIDGLDEYHGQSVENLRLARLLSSWGQSQHFKIVCAARPHSEFLAIFTDPSRTMRLHLMTDGDIHNFVEAQLREEADVSDGRYTESQICGLVKEIVWRSEGVFLWAHLAVRAVLSGMAGFDSHQALQETLGDTPSELNEIFSRMLSNVDKTIQERSYTMLRLAAGQPVSIAFYGLTPLDFSWIDELRRPSFPFDSSRTPLSWPEVERRQQAATRQIARLTKGLLEVRTARSYQHRPHHQFERVEFFHKTARDFVLDGGISPPVQERKRGDERDYIAESFGLRVQYVKQYPDPDDLEAMFNLAESFFFCCYYSMYQLPVELADAIGDILDDLESKRTAEDRANNWTVITGEPAEGDLKGWPRPPWTHMELAFHTGQHRYLSWKIEQSPERWQFPAGQMALWLQHCAPSRVRWFRQSHSHKGEIIPVRWQRWKVALSSMEIVFRAGASPKDTVPTFWYPKNCPDGRSGPGFQRYAPLWTIFLLRMEDSVRETRDSYDPYGAGQIRREDCAGWFSALEVFLKHGADPNVLICSTYSTKGGRETVAVALGQIVRYFRPENYEALLGLLDSTAAWESGRAVYQRAARVFASRVAGSPQHQGQVVAWTSPACGYEASQEPELKSNPLRGFHGIIFGEELELELDMNSYCCMIASPVPSTCFDREVPDQALE